MWRSRGFVTSPRAAGEVGRGSGREGDFLASNSIFVLVKRALSGRYRVRLSRRESDVSRPLTFEIPILAARSESAQHGIFVG